MNNPWHLLVYIAADNSLYKDALVSLRQLTAGSRSNNVRITVQFEGPTSDEVVRYSCAGGTREKIWVAPKGYTHDRATRLRDFLNQAPKGPKDERTFLILWGHGAGIDHLYLYSDPADSKSKPADHAGASAHAGGAATPHVHRTIPVALLNSDTDNANRYVKDIRLREILDEYKAKLGRPIDILGFDSCLMGMAEICHEVSTSVDRVIASDEEIPEGSWPYDTILQDLTQCPGMDPSALSVAIVGRYMERYSKESSQARISLSAYSLQACGQLKDAVREFVDLVDPSNYEQRSLVLLARDFSRTPEVPDYIDLGIFCNEIIQSFGASSKIGKVANKIRNILTEEYMLYHRDAGEEGIAPATGLAVYFPQVMPPTWTEVEAALKDTPHLRSYDPSGPAAGTQLQIDVNNQEGVQPAQDIGMKTPTGDRMKSLLVFKTPTGDRMKTPTGDSMKSIGVPVVQRQLIGSEVLWDNYLKLHFNKETHWAEMIQKLITYPR